MKPKYSLEQTHRNVTTVRMAVAAHESAAAAVGAIAGSARYAAAAVPLTERIDTDGPGNVATVANAR